MPSDENDTGAFDYQGYLLFNGIYQVDLLDEEFGGGRQEARTLLRERLPDYDREDGHSEDGYKRLLINEEIFDDSTIDSDIEEIAQSLVAFRYLYEDRQPTDAYYQGEQVTVEVPNVKDTDLYWIYPNHVYLRGSQEDVSQTRETTRRALEENIRLDPVDFSGDFLLWLFYKESQDQPVPCGIDVDYFTDATLKGSRDPFGGENKVDDSTDLSRCVPVIAGVLKDKTVSMLEGYFDLFDTYKIKTQIGGGRVHVKSSTGDIQTSGDVRRVTMSLAFLDELMCLYEYWDDLSQTEKYPPRTFFNDLYQTASDQGVHIDSISNNVLRQYANKRGEDPDDWIN